MKSDWRFLNTDSYSAAMNMAVDNTLLRDPMLLGIKLNTDVNRQKKTDYQPNKTKKDKNST